MTFSKILTILHSQTDRSIPLDKLNVTVIAEGTRESPKRLGVSASNCDSAAETTLYTMMMLLACDGRES
jgi:hypothetical protein